ncbi:MAG TPA: type 1 glutamine amidotransferase [Geminicoccus sp.]|uniref:type 1 glutamine amidotransferase n=1 Tax=Geminicoccus sp. TaxID=2024832 RepID=UPI002B8EAA30|nr:type 1 glutamine amidotransferase [Geminicoccus sp.]HWL68461.1 type 1 glutamine amidotransferase [Geminicoccus sp.]
MFQRPLRLLVVEGNTAETCDRIRKITGQTMSDNYAEVLRRAAPDATVDICYPAFPGANLPDAAGLDSYDGVAITGSALNIYDRGPAIDPQIELARAVYRSGVPFFGSCWGLQVATVAAGGEVRKNPKGRELGIARKITLTEFGQSHQMHAGRPPVFDAPCVHLDEVGISPDGLKITACNEVSDVQAAEIRHEGGLFWGVQYHPEFSLLDLAAVMLRYGPVLWKEGFFPDEASAMAFVDDLKAVHADPAGRWDLAWRYGFGREITDPMLRQNEITNWIEHYVQPTRSARGRG